jgi:hypothetical protein
MKKILLLFLFSASLFTSFAQKTNLVFFTEQGERFTVILNGIRQNPTPETNFKVTDLIAPSYKLKIIFEDPKLGEIDKNLLFNQGTETTFVIKKKNNGEYVVRWMNEVPVEEALPPAQGQTVIIYTTVAPPATTTVSHSQTVITTNNSGIPPQGDNVSMGINMNDPNGGMNINMNINPGGMPPAGTTTSSTTTTTTTTTTGTMNGYPPASTPPAITPPQPVYILPGYSGPTGCPYPMSPNDFASVKQSIMSKDFENSKLTIAKQVIGSNCLLCSQVKEIMLLFDFENTRLELAKYAYGYTFDIGNYYKLNDAFTFESSIDQLNKYINSHRR